MSSQIFFHGKYANVSDGVVVFLLHMLLDALGRTAEDGWSRRVRAKWHSRLAGCGFGCYELDLEALVTNAEERQRMVQIFELARNAMQNLGPRLNKEWLNSLEPRETIYGEDVETSWFVDKLQEIHELLKTDGADPTKT